jgi:hypothetical protein
LARTKPGRSEGELEPAQGGARALRALRQLRRRFRGRAVPDVLIVVGSARHIHGGKQHARLRPEHVLDVFASERWLGSKKTGATEVKVDATNGKVVSVGTDSEDEGPGERGEEPPAKH